MTAISLVPPPMSTISEPTDSPTGRPCTDRGRERLVDQRRVRGARGERRLLDSAPLHRRDPAWHADHHVGAQMLSAEDTADEMPQHLLGRLEIGDHPVSERTCRLDGAGVRPIICRACAPTARTSRLRSSIATTDGSTTRSLAASKTTVFAMPRSTASCRLEMEPPSLTPARLPRTLSAQRSPTPPAASPAQATHNQPQRAVAPERRNRGSHGHNGWHDTPEAPATAPTASKPSRSTIRAASHARPARRVSARPARPAIGAEDEAGGAARRPVAG